MNSPYKIAVVGLWHLGEIYSVGLAQLGHQVLGLSNDEKIISDFSKNIPPLPEPELEELIKKNLEAGRLNYSQDFSAIKNCNVLWLTLDTPVNDKDEADLTPIYQALEKSLPYLNPGVLVVVTSQIPIGTSAKIVNLIQTQCPNLDFDYVYTPENLRLGEAVRCFFEPGRIVVGASSEKASQKIKAIFAGLKCEILEMSPASAEMVKHAVNSFLATSVSFINDIADICERVGADVITVTQALRSEPRIGPKAFLDAGLGFSGGTLGRDLKALLSLSREKSLDLPIIENVYQKNFLRRNLVKNRLESFLGTLTGKTIAIFGLTYKPGTKTLRRSRALEVAKDLMAAGSRVKLSDPEADPKELESLGSFDFFKDPYEAARGAQALVLVTPWPIFKTLDFEKLSLETAPLPIFFDTANFLWDKEKEIIASGFKYFGVGRN